MTNTVKLQLKLQHCLLVAFLHLCALCPRSLPSGDTLFILQRLFLHHQITKYMRDYLKFDLLILTEGPKGPDEDWLTIDLWLLQAQQMKEAKMK